MAFSWIDVFLLLLIFLSAWGGWRRGFILGALPWVYGLGSLLAGWLYFEPVAHWLGAKTGLSEVWRQPIAFFLVILLTRLILGRLGRVLLGRLPRAVRQGSLNRLFGLIPGLANGFITAVLIAALLLVAPLPDSWREAARDSAMAERFAGMAEPLTTALLPIFEEALIHTLRRRIVTDTGPALNERKPLPFRVEAPAPRPYLEAEMLELVNGERIKAGLSPLKSDPALTEVARRHSADMFARRYFSHYTPENRSPFDRMREARVTFLIAGENLALAPSIRIAHDGLMHSPGHRENILRPQFRRVGIGIMDGGIHGLMVTQKFRN